MSDRSVGAHADRFGDHAGFRRSSDRLRVGLKGRMFTASALLALVVGAAFAVLLLSIGDLRSSSTKAQHSEQVLAAASGLETVVLDLETGARGFILTGQQRFLEPWTSGLAAFPVDGAALVRLVRDNPPQEARAKAIVRAGRLYISQYSEPLVMLARHDRRDASGLVATGEGKQRVDSMRAQFNRLVAAEDVLLVSHRANASSLARRAELIGIAGIVAAAILIFLFALYLARVVVLPVRRVSAAAALLADGDLSARVPGGGRGEVAELGRSFNTMAAAISRDAENRDLADIERVHLEEQLRQSQKMEAVGSLAGGIAHDFNNLLMVIRGYTDAVMTRNVDTSLDEGLGHINDAAVRAGELTRQLLAYSRQQVLRPETASLNDVVGDTLKLLTRLIGTDIEIATELEPGLFPIVIDRGQLGQVILNLAVNAREAMPNGGRLTLRTTNLCVDVIDKPSHFDVGLPPGEYALLEITDTGMGMDEATRSRVFDPFFTTKAEGTGLGLATVFGIVKQSGAHISVWSELGRGTTFKVYFPHDTAGPAAAPAPEPPLSLHGHETILVVEDDSVVRPLVTNILEAYGYDVMPAANGPAAILIAEREHGSIDLLFTDIVMPGMNGRELADILCAGDPTLKVVFTSGYPSDAMLRSGLRSANVSFIEKPYLPEDLARMVRGVLDAAKN
jgi:signal transduction histidine kinase